MAMATSMSVQQRRAFCSATFRSQASVGRVAIAFFARWIGNLAPGQNTKAPCLNIYTGGGGRASIRARPGPSQ